ncbi:hypothetical protein GYMLUDRAFT_39986 [Collybiopsis luxurians FD-317 M1]|nr:hypothetical protein GYMLUDRAFT_39986 [Collybiopsis luxurians FD-317 M1]
MEPVVEMYASDERFKGAQQYTTRLFGSIDGSRMKWCILRICFCAVRVEGSFQVMKNGENSVGGMREEMENR